MSGRQGFTEPLPVPRLLPLYLSWKIPQATETEQPLSQITGFECHPTCLGGYWQSSSQVSVWNGGACSSVKNTLLLHTRPWARFPASQEEMEIKWSDAFFLCSGSPWRNRVGVLQCYHADMKNYWWRWGDAQLVKCLVDMHENLSSSLPTSKPGVLGRGEHRLDPLMSMVRYSSQSVNSRFCEGF